MHIDTVQLVAGSRSDEFSQFFAPREYRALEGQGSGVIVDTSGYIVTNYHVVEHARPSSQAQRRRNPFGRSSGRRRLDRFGRGKNRLRRTDRGPWGDSDALQVGGLVWAVGNPFGLDRTVTFGIVSAKSRHGLGANPYEDFLQTDAAVNPGNSGGPLVNTAGEIVGINTAITARGQGISFAIPSSMARDVYDRLRASGKVVRGFLGATLADITPALAKQLELTATKGAFVKAVLDDTPAAKAGVEPGDVIVRWDGHDVNDATELLLLVGKTKIGEKVSVALIRNGETKTLEVIVEERPANPVR